MSRRRREVTWVAFALAAMLWACGDDAVTRPNPAEQATDRVLISRAGIAVPEPQMRAALARVTRDAAIALADPAVRALVYEKLHASPYREHKLHFDTFLRGDARSLLSAMAAARSATPGAAPSTSAEAAANAVLATLDTIVDLEFYMPVKAHLAEWNGDASLLVASALDDDGSIPVGFDLAGLPVTLSAAEPPATPTLVVVPVETDFSRIPSAGAPGGVDAATTDIAGVHMTRSVIFSDHEGWPNGNPEFEVHLFQTDVDLEYIDNICAGERREAPYTYNTQEVLDWTGDVVLATEGRMALSPNNQFQVWEDDSDPCTLTGGRPPRADQFTISEMTNWASAFLGITATASGDAVAIIKFLLNAVPAAYNFYVDPSDDPVGVLKLSGGCWPATGPAHFEIVSSRNGHALNGWATMDYRFAAAQRDPVCPQPTPPSLNVGITGPTQIRPGATCTWDAVVSNGSAPYSYTWFNDNLARGTGPSYTGSKDAGNSNDRFAIRVRVTDATNAWGEKTITVVEVSSARTCFI